MPGLPFPFAMVIRPRCVFDSLGGLFFRAVVIAVVLLAHASFQVCHAAAPTQGAGPAPVHQVREVYRLPHEPGAFTQGLFFVHGRLFETTGRHGQSRLMELNPQTGRVLRSRFLPAQYFGEGAVAVGQRIIWLTWTSQQAFVFDLETFEPVGEYPYQGEGWGLTFDGARLIMSDGGSSLVLRDPQSFEPLGSVQVTDGGVAVDLLNELEWAAGFVYANVWRESRIAVIDPGTGSVVCWLDLEPVVPLVLDPSAVANGIAFDERNDCLLITGKLWPEMICVQPLP
ncbi:MAG: glutaminyl-peptide cyclotransferase [Proteobacteria bacterium]|nr:glutaminyl-peptide cyclotransferase [Pseudomonadota bacterium]